MDKNTYKRSIFTFSSKYYYIWPLGFADFIKYWEIQLNSRGDGVKWPSEQIFIFAFYVFYVIACNLKISFYKINSPLKKSVLIRATSSNFSKIIYLKDLSLFWKWGWVPFIIILLKVSFDTLIKNIKT